MRYWDGCKPLPCMEGMGLGTHLLVASQGGWSFLCAERPERWQSMEGATTGDPLVIQHSDSPTCETCALLIKRNLESYLTASNWPITWRRVS